MQIDLHTITSQRPITYDIYTYDIPTYIHIVYNTSNISKMFIVSTRRVVVVVVVVSVDVRLAAADCVCDRGHSNNKHAAIVTVNVHIGHTSRSAYHLNCVYAHAVLCVLHRHDIKKKTIVHIRWPT